MLNPQLDSLKTRFDLGTGPSDPPGGERLFIWQYFLTGDEFPGWASHRIQPVPAAGGQRVTQTIWRAVEEKEEALLSLDLFECPSRTEAFDTLLRLLGEFQSPQVRRVDSGGPGEIAFSAPQDLAMLFARGNLVALLRSVGPRPAPVTQAAARFDQSLAARPAPDQLRERVAPSINTFALGSAGESQERPITLEAADPLGRPLWYKFYAQAGEVFTRDSHLFYRPAAQEPGAITVYALNANHAAAEARLP